MLNSVSASTNSSISQSDDKTVSTPSYTISYLDKNVGGNVLKNSKISKNMPKTQLSKKIVKMSKKGSVILKFGKGKPKVLICAGIHGNEVAANIATLILIEHIKNKKIKGSVYIIPFAIPKSTALNTRTWSNKGDPNRIANIHGTPGYKIVNFAKKNNITNIIDVHAGEQLSSHKKGFIYTHKKPTNLKETKWLKYIKKKTNAHITYNVSMKGYIRGYSKTKKISTITFEVERSRGSVST